MKRKANHEITEAKLSKLLFNKKDDLLNNLKKHKNDDHSIEDDIMPAWVDEDDIDINTKSGKVKSKESTLKQKYETLMGTPSWAKITKDPETEDTDSSKISKTVGHLLKSKNNKFVSGLKKGLLEFKRMPKINSTTHNEGALITCIEFHPKSSVALVFGNAGIASLFSVGDSTNHKLHSIKLKKWSNDSSAQFTPDGNEAFLSCDKVGYFYVYDLIKAEANMFECPQNAKRPRHFQLSPDGKYYAITDGFDEVYIMCAKSKELLRHLKQSSDIVALTFTPDSKLLYCYGIHGAVTLWDLSTYRAVKRFYDNGCVKGSCIAISPCGRLLATGSAEGIVNIYQVEDITTEEPIPQKVFSNLTTKITLLKFNPTTEILAIASSILPNALRLLHIPSYQAFTNFPQSNLNLQLIKSLSFSPNSGFMAIGDNKGNALLFRLKYYKNY